MYFFKQNNQLEPIYQNDKSLLVYLREILVSIFWLAVYDLNYTCTKTQNGKQMENSGQCCNWLTPKWSYPLVTIQSASRRMLNIISCWISFLFTSVSIHLFKKKSVLHFTIDSSKQLLITLFKLADYAGKTQRKSLGFNGLISIVTSTHRRLVIILLLIIDWTFKFVFIKWYQFRFD